MYLFDYHDPRPVINTSINSDYKSFDELHESIMKKRRSMLFKRHLGSFQKEFPKGGFRTRNGFMPKLDLNDPGSFKNDPGSFKNDSKTSVVTRYQNHWFRVWGCYKVVDDDNGNSRPPYTILKLLQEQQKQR